MVARDVVLLAEFTGARYTWRTCRRAASVRALREAKARGLAVTAEVTPHHFTLTDEAVARLRHRRQDESAAARRQDVEALREALADGTIDCIATDHAPHGPSDKNIEFDKAANGVVGLETALPLVLELTRSGALTPMRAVELLTDGPARAFRLPGGHLAKGAPADVTVIDPQVQWTVEPAAVRVQGPEHPVRRPEGPRASNPHHRGRTSGI